MLAAASTKSCKLSVSDVEGRHNAPFQSAKPPFFIPYPKSTLSTLPASLFSLPSTLPRVLAPVFSAGRMEIGRRGDEVRRHQGLEAAGQLNCRCPNHGCSHKGFDWNKSGGGRLDSTGCLKYSFNSRVKCSNCVESCDLFARQMTVKRYIKPIC